MQILIRSVLAVWCGSLLACTGLLPANNISSGAAPAPTEVSRLETRIAEIERQQARRDREDAARVQQQILDRLDKLVALNETLAANVSTPPVETALGLPLPSVQEPEAPPQATGNPRIDGLPTATAPVPDPDADFRTRLQSLVAEFQTDRSPWNGFSFEQQQALRVLLRPERQLDTKNPWRR